MATADPYASSAKAATTDTSGPLHPASLRRGTLILNPAHLAHPDAPPISSALYSGFIEHVGRGIYGGLVDQPEHPSPPDLLEKQDKGDERTRGRAGWRKDVMRLMGKDGELGMPILRWPGGNFVSNYHWQDGVGPIKDRPKRIELAWRATESNQFGTDEFIDYCRAINVEPYFCLNMGTGSFEEALSWLEYCNGTGDTHWANLRRKNTGRDEPHNVKLWGLGNEMYGPWQVGNLSATDYTKKAKKWAHALKLVDPSIQLVSCGEQGNSDWDREVLQGLVGTVDYHSIHFYSVLGHERTNHFPGHIYEKNVFGPAAAERSIEVCQSLIDLAKIGLAAAGKPIKDTKICYDEWNVWDETKAPGDGGLEQTYDYTDMLGFCAWLNLLVRKHREVAIACLAQSVNVIAPVMTRPDGLLFQTLWYPLKLFSNYMKDGRIIQTTYNSEPYTGPTYPEWIQHVAPPVYVDTVAVFAETTKGASIRISVLNRHPEADWTGDFELQGFDVSSVEVHETYHDNLDAANTWDTPDEVKPKVTKIDGKEWTSKAKGWKVKKHAWTFIIIDGKVKA